MSAPKVARMPMSLGDRISKAAAESKGDAVLDVSGLGTGGNGSIKKLKSPSMMKADGTPKRISANRQKFGAKVNGVKLVSSTPEGLSAAFMMIGLNGDSALKLWQQDSDEHMARLNAQKANSSAAAKAKRQNYNEANKDKNTARRKQLALLAKSAKSPNSRGSQAAYKAIPADDRKARTAYLQQYQPRVVGSPRMSNLSSATVTTAGL
jgi:hypothetical protein